MCFLSLIFSEIKPIIDFGLMMTLGLIVSFIVTFFLLPSLLNVFSSENEINVKDTEKSLITSVFASIAKKNSIFIFIFTFLVILASFVGVLKLEVENSFINYFDKETEIYKGMKKIDEDLGGTTPLNIIVKFPLNKIRTLIKKKMSFQNGTKIMRIKKLSQSTGLQEIKWTKSLWYMTI